MKKHSPNFILASLTDQAHHCISRYLSKVEYPAQHVLYEDGEVIPYVYFPLRGVISLVKASADEQTVETGIIGSEGLVGLPIVFGIQRAANRATVQFDCECERLPTQVFLQALAQHSAMKQLVLRYAYTMFLQVSQSVLCTRFHSVRQRFCRWLLMMSDRMEGAELRLTQEGISMLTGARRTQITELTGQLEKEGLIERGYGKVLITDKKRLQKMACECYAILTAEYEKFLRSGVQE